MTGDRSSDGRKALAVSVVLLLVVSLLAFLPGVQAARKAPFVLGGALGVSVPRPWAPAVERRSTQLRGVVVDRYSPGSSAPPVLMVPGAARAGRQDARVVAFATSLARAGREVVVPELTLYQRELDAADVDRVVRVARSLCPEDGGLVLLGFSYGGALALVAAGDPRIAGCIDVVATFGAYADLVGVLEAAASGASLVQGARFTWRTDDRSLAREVLQDAAVELVPQEQREPLRQALDARDPTGLPQGSRAAYDLVTADAPERVRALVDRLPEHGRELIEALSPVAVADDVTARVLAVHALDDPAVPFAELLRLREAFPDAETTAVESFQHVDLNRSGDLRTLLRDLLVASDFLRDVLAAQEE